MAVSVAANIVLDTHAFMRMKAMLRWDRSFGVTKRYLNERNAAATAHPMK